MEYPSNANMPQPPQLEKPSESSKSVITSKPKVKTNTPKGLKGVIFSQDFKDIKQGVFDDIIRPKIKEMAYRFVENIVNTVDSTIQMMIFGDVGRPTSRPGDRVSYNQFSNTKKPNPQISSVAYEHGTIEYPTRGDAERVLQEMQDWLYRFPYVEVSRMYEFSNLSMPNWTSNNYGWDNLDGVTVKRTFEGQYIIDLPRAKPLPK
jgi:hypothetical protein